MPPALVSTQTPAVLGFPIPPRVVRSDEFDPPLFQLCVERVAVVGLVADQEPRERFREAGVNGFDDELLLISRTTRNPCGDRKTRAVWNDHDLGREAASSSPNQRAPLFAPAWVPSMKASVRSSFPRLRRCSARDRRIFSMVPSRTQPWNRRWHVWYGG